MAALLISAALASWTTKAAADGAQPVLGSNRPVPSAIMHVGSLHVEKYGSGEPAVILVPGLACGMWVWDGTIRSLQAKHVVYAVTLAGFDGTSAVSTPVIDKAEASIKQLIDTEHLMKPVLIGHSLGGFLTIRFAEEHSDLLGGAVTVDGMPVFPTMAQMTADQRRAAASQFSAPLRGQSHDQFAQGERQFISGMVSDPRIASRVGDLAAKSDPNATADYLQEMLEADLRPALGSVHVPLLVIAPIPKDVPPDYPDSMRSMTLEQLSASIVGFDQALFAGATTVKVVPIVNARHFAMLDQPDAFNTVISGFVDGPR